MRDGEKRAWIATLRQNWPLDTPNRDDLIALGGILERFWFPEKPTQEHIDLLRQDWPADMPCRESLHELAEILNQQLFKGPGRRDDTTWDIANKHLKNIGLRQEIEREAALVEKRGEIPDRIAIEKEVAARHNIDRRALRKRLGLEGAK
jgi:hypothetical protein